MDRNCLKKHAQHPESPENAMSSNALLRDDNLIEENSLSLIFDKRPKTGSTTINGLLRREYQGKKFVNCGVHSGNDSMPIMLNQTKKEGFDIFDCHMLTGWEERKLTESRARGRPLWVTTTRDPFDRFISHWKHHLRMRTRNSSNTCFDFPLSKLMPFFQEVHSPPLRWELGSVSNLRSEVSTGKICSRWDIILETETLLEDAEIYLGLRRLPNKNVSLNMAPPSSCGDVPVPVAEVMKKVLEDEYIHHQALLKCKHLNKRIKPIKGNIAFA